MAKHPVMKRIDAICQTHWETRNSGDYPIHFSADEYESLVDSLMAPGICHCFCPMSEPFPPKRFEISAYVNPITGQKMPVEKSGDHYIVTIAACTVAAA